MELHASRHFATWLAEQQTSIALSTYDAGKLIAVGLNGSGGLAANERSFNRAMGVCGNSERLWAATSYQLWRFDNALAPGKTDGDVDGLYIPRRGYVTGDIDVHDLAVAGDSLYFVSTLFSCIGTLSETSSFKPFWRPTFVSRLAAEDRCHLNGLAMRDDYPRYATAVARSDVEQGWRDFRRDGGVAIDTQSNEVIAEGFSMPHSPRWYRDRLWLLDSGNGRFGFVDARGQFETVVFCPGYARGLSFVGDYALVGLSQPRDKTFEGLALDESLAKRGVKVRTGVAVIDLRRGDLVHSLFVDERIREIYDVVSLPGVRRARLLGFKSDEIRNTLSIEGEPGIWRTAS